MVSLHVQTYKSSVHTFMWHTRVFVCFTIGKRKPLTTLIAMILEFHLHVLTSCKPSIHGSRSIKVC